MAVRVIKPSIKTGANTSDQIKIPDSSVNGIENYQKIGSGICYDTSTSDTAGTWNVTIPNITELTEGLTIKVRLKTSYNSTTNTLNVNGLGAKTVYFRYGTKLTSHYAKESVLALTYTASAIGSGTDTSGWIVENIYDSTNTYQLRVYNTKPKTKSALYRYMICFVNNDGLLIPANNTSNSTATTKTLTTESFNLFDNIYYYNSTTTINANGQVGTGTLYKQLSIDLRYSFNTGTTLVAPNGVYLKVTADGSQFKLATDTPVTQSLPTSDDGYFYCYLGRAYSTYQIELVPEHPIYLYKNGIIQEYRAYAKSVAETALSGLDGKANLAGGNTFSGLQTIDAPTDVSGSETTTLKAKTSNGGAIIFGKEGANSGTMIRLDQADGTCRLRFRGSSTAGAMVWEQPEEGAQLYVDLGKDGSDKHRVSFPSSAGTLALTSQIPTVNNGTLTIQKNGTNVQTFTANQSSSVTANITVPTKTSELTNDSGYLTAHQDISGKLSKTENTGVSVLGTTKATTTLGGNQLVAPNGIIFAGTAANAGLVTRGICGVSTPDSKGACAKDNLYINYDGTNTYNTGRMLILQAGETGTNYGNNMYQYAVPRGDIVKAWVEAKGYLTSHQDISGKANLSGGNYFTGRQSIGIDNTGYVLDVQTDTQDCGTVFGVEKTGSGYSGSSRIIIDGDGLENVELEIGGNAGTSGQVLTSQGAGKTPSWTTPPIKSATLSGTTLTITLS